MASSPSPIAREESTLFSASPSGVASTSDLASIQLRAQHGIYSSISNAGASSAPALSASQLESNTIEKSISLTAAAPPLRLAPPFPGPCPMTAGQGGGSGGAGASGANAGGGRVLPGGSSNNNNNNGSGPSWKDSDPSKTHAVIVALCLGRAAWEFQSDDAPVQLVNGGAPPLLAVAPDEGMMDGGGDDNMRARNKLVAANAGGAKDGGGGGIAFHIEKSRAAAQQHQQQQQQLLQNLPRGAGGGGGGPAGPGGVVAGTTANPIAPPPTGVAGAASTQGGGGGGAVVGDRQKSDRQHGINNNNNGNNHFQPTITPPGAPSTLYSWRALRAHSDIATKSCARAGEGIEALYTEMVKPKPGSGPHVTKVVMPLINPTTEHIRDVLHKGATDAADEQHRRNLSRSSRDIATGSNLYTGPNKLLLHYVGHGVPRPERGCLYFARQATQRQHNAFTPVREILHLLGVPCMLICDCACAGNVRSALVAVERELNPYSATKENRFFWGSCADGEPLPQHPLMPDDLFSSILLSPIRMAVLFFIVQHKGLFDFPPYLVHCFANEWAQNVKPGSAVAEVRSAFNAIVESIAAKVLAPDVFYVCFRQDTVVLNLFRGFVLAQRIIGWLGQEPCSHPHVPPDTAQHPLWQSFDFVVEGVLGSIVRAWRPKPVFGLSVHAFRMSLDPTLVVKNMPEVPQVRATTFFYDSLVSLQGIFDSAQAQALVAGSLVDPPGRGDHGNRNTATGAGGERVVSSYYSGGGGGGGAGNGGGGSSTSYGVVLGPQVDLLTHSIETWSSMGGGGATSESDRTSTLDGSSTNTVDFASYLLQRGERGHGGLPMARLPGAGSGEDFANNKELISFVSTRFPILQHSFVQRDTRFFAMMILARWLDLGAIAVECCDLFGLFREILFQVWNLKPVDDQDAPMVLIAAKTALVDTKHLLVQRSLQVPATYCARVFNNPAEPSSREVAHRLGILGQPATQRWFAAAAIALMTLKQPQLAVSVLIQQQQQQSVVITSAAAKTCIEIINTPVPPRRNGSPDSDTEPSIASNLKSACVALLSVMVYSLRDSSGPLLVDFLLPALRDSWIDAVAGLIAHRDSTPRLRWGSARALHIFLVALQRLHLIHQSHANHAASAAAAAASLKISDLCMSLCVRVVSKLVAHTATLEGNVDVRREVVGAFTAFAINQPDTMLSPALQGEMRAQFTGTPSPNRQQLPSLYNNYIQMQLAQHQQKQSQAAATSLLPPSARGIGSGNGGGGSGNLSDHQQLLSRRSQSDLLNISQNSLTGESGERLSSTPPLSVINTPNRGPQQMDSQLSYGGGGGGLGGGSNGTSAFPSRLDFPGPPANHSMVHTFCDVSADTTMISGVHPTADLSSTVADDSQDDAFSEQNGYSTSGNGANSLDEKTLALLLAVKWILSLRADAHPVLRVLCVRALQRFVAEKFVTLSLFTKPSTRTMMHQQQQSSPSSTSQQQPHHEPGVASTTARESGLRAGVAQQSLQQQQAAQPRKTMFDRFTGFFSSSDNNNNNNNNSTAPHGVVSGSRLSGRDNNALSNVLSPTKTGGGGGSGGGSGSAGSPPDDLDKLLFSETDASFDFDAPSLLLLDLDSPDAEDDIFEFVYEMLRALTKPVVPRICQRVSLGDLPPRLARPQTTAAAITAACSAPLVGDVAPHRCVFHSFVKHTLAKAKTAKHDSALSDIVSRHVYNSVDAAHVVFHPTEQFAVCCSADDVLSVVSTAPRDKRVLMQQRIEGILPNGVDESALFPPSAASALGGAGSRLGGLGLGNDLSDGEGRTPSVGESRGAGGSLFDGGGIVSAIKTMGRARTSALVLLDAVHSHTAAVVTTTGCVRLVTDVASRSGVRLATAFPGVSSTIEYQSANSTIHGGGGGGAAAAASSSPPSSASYGRHQATATNTSSVAAYQPLGQRLLVTGEGCRYALWDLGQQRKIDERAALPLLSAAGSGGLSTSGSITCAVGLASSPESFCLGMTRAIVVTDHRMREAAGTLHIPEAFGGAGCVSVVSHPGAPTRITGVSYSGLTCIWDLRYALDIGDGRALLAGYGSGAQLRPGMSRAALPRSAHLPGVLGKGESGADTAAAAASRVSCAAIHTLFADAPLIAAGCWTAAGPRFRIMLHEQVLASRNEQPVVCAWHPFEILGALVPWSADPRACRLEIYAAASKEQRSDHIVDLIL